MYKLNIGGGNKRYDGFLNIDYDHSTRPDHVLNLETDRLPFDDNTVDEVKAYHVLEHLGEGYFHALQELYRVCKDGAIIDIQVPHPQHEFYLNDPTHRRPIMPEGMRLFSKKYNDHNKALGGTSSNLGYYFNVDFEILNVRFIHDPFYDEIIKSNTYDQNVRMMRECINVCQEIHMLLVVVK